MAASAQTTETRPAAWRRIGRYELGPKLAAGGMAELYVARATGVHGFQKYVAIKRILPRFTDDREFVEMFLDEARLAAQLEHPNVVHVHDIGEDDDGPFFTMDYIHGQNLLAIVRRLRTCGSTLPWDAFVALGSAAAAGLHHAHERRGFDGRPLGIIHRDVSPTNVLVTHEGVVKIVDFGIAKASTSRHSTRPSVRKGKMAYMSPEQCRGDVLDRRSDVFALGVVLYELATLGRAFKAEGEFAVMNQIVNHDLPPASSRRAEVPAELDRILARALSRDPRDRYQSARELQRELDEFAVDQGLLATPQALAGVMEELFGAEPYPWEGAVEATAGAGEDASAHETEATESRPTTAKPAVATRETRVEPIATRADDRPAGRRRAWVIGGLAAGVLGAVAWIAVPRGQAAISEPEPVDGEAKPPSASLERIGSEDASIVTPTPSPTSDAAPTEPDAPVAETPAGAPQGASVADPAAAPPPLADAPTAPADDSAPSPDEPASATKPVRRSGKATRPRSSPEPTDAAAAPSPTLPAPFDPDAPAPRVR